MNQFEIDHLNSKVIDDVSRLGKIYRSKKLNYLTKSVDHALVEDYIKEGWEEVRSLQTKTIIRKNKSHSQRFEDQIWCQIYELGYRKMNYDDQFFLPFSSRPEDKKQIDVVAIDDESILIIECKSSEKPVKAPSYKDEFELLSLRYHGFISNLRTAFGEQKKVKYIFATRNLRINKDSQDLLRLNNTGSFYYNDNTYDYINSLISKYKDASRFQFLSLIFKKELISKERIEIPALQGKMGGKVYYIFSIEPSLLLKMGYVLHRTRANETEFPTYQRLLVPTRLDGIRKFIEHGGFFPNSIIVNFNTRDHKLNFEAHSKLSSSMSRTGILKIPNVYGIAYIIDGQHRVYGYAGTNYSTTNTVPVVAFNNLETSEQLEMFMDINQNQKPVSPSLRLDLEEDLYWDSDRADSRLKALRSSIIKSLANKVSSPLYGLISVGEDSSRLAFKPFTAAISASGLLPVAKGNQYKEDSLIGSLYNTANHDHSAEMLAAKQRIADLLMGCYEIVSTSYEEIFVDDRSLILSNRGTYAFICIIGSINKYLTEKSFVDILTPTDIRIKKLDKYIRGLLEDLNTINTDEKDRLLSSLGAGADLDWLRTYQQIINERFNDYLPTELIDWRERKNGELQTKASEILAKIESYIKATVLTQLKAIYSDNWELEINTVKRQCSERAEEEMVRNYKEGLGNKKIHWTEMFTISDYKNIISTHWTKSPPGVEEKNFKSFDRLFAIDIREGFSSRTEKLKWLSYVNSHRNKLSHRGTKGVGLNKEEVDFLKNVAEMLNME